jgi:hypothetical protein
MYANDTNTLHLHVQDRESYTIIKTLENTIQPNETYITRA